MEQYLLNKFTEKERYVVMCRTCGVTLMTSPTDPARDIAKRTVVNLTVREHVAAYRKPHIVEFIDMESRVGTSLSDTDRLGRPRMSSYL